MPHPALLTQAAETPLGFESRSLPRLPRLPGADGDGIVLARLAEQVVAAAPLRRALATLAGRLVTTRAWERLGFARVRDYAVERVGVSGRHLQELAQVDAALAALPLVDGALTAGRLSWTKARLLCRAATGESEARWLETASRMRARALAREVRAVDARALENDGTPLPAALVDEVDDEEGPRQTVFLHCSAPTRGKWCHTRLLANRVAGERLAPWACAEAVAAEVLSAIGLEAGQEKRREERDGGEEEGGEREETEEEKGEGQEEEGGRGDRARYPAASPKEPSHGAPGVGKAAGAELEPSRAAEVSPSPPPATTAFVERLVGGLEEADAFELDARLRRAVRLEARHLASLGPWLLAVASRRLFRDLGYQSLDAYAREELGMSGGKARVLLRIERLAQGSPALGTAWRQGQISWTQAQALAPLLALADSAPWHPAWIERARRVTVRRLEEDVDAAIASGDLDPAALPSLATPFAADSPAGLTTGARPRVSGETVRLFFNAPRDVARLFRAVLASVQRRIERLVGQPSSEGEAFDAMLDHALQSWGSPRRPSPRRYAVFARDGWRCTVPGCTSYRNLQDHHIAFRSAGGTDALANRTTLCAWHHLRGVHGGVVACRGEAPGKLRFELGLRRGGPPLLQYASGDWLVGMG